MPSLVEIGPVVLEKIFWFCQCIFRYFVIISPWKRAGSFIWTNLNSHHPRMLLCKVCLKLAQWFWRRRWKCVKFTDGRTDGRTDRQTTDDRWSEKLTWAFSSGELKKPEADKFNKIKFERQTNIQTNMYISYTVQLVIY